MKIGRLFPPNFYHIIATIQGKTQPCLRASLLHPVGKLSDWPDLPGNFLMLALKMLISQECLQSQESQDSSFPWPWMPTTLNLLSWISVAPRALYIGKRHLLPPRSVSSQSKESLSILFPISNHAQPHGSVELAKDYTMNPTNTMKTIAELCNRNSL